MKQKSKLNCDVNQLTKPPNGHYLGHKLQSIAGLVGTFCQRNATFQLFFGIFMMVAFAVSLKCAVFEPDVQNLWVPKPNIFQTDVSTEYTRNSLSEPNLVLIQTPKPGHPDVNLLEPDALLVHLEVMKVATQISIDLFEIPWKLKDICYSLNPPDIEEYNVLQMIEKLLPCVIATPLDCFWEGSKLLGPDDEVQLPNIGLVRWTNLNPSKLLQQLTADGDQSEFESNSNGPSFSSLIQMLQRGGVSTAYQNKQCLDPTDEECPLTSPNRNGSLTPDVTSALVNGCSGFATKWLNWPQPLLLGGIRKNRTNRLSHASALQSVLQLMSDLDLFEFYRNHFKVLSIDWNLDKARQVLDAWQRQLTQQLHQWKLINGHTSPYDLHHFTPVALIDSMRRFNTLPAVSTATAITCLFLHLLFTISRTKSFKVNKKDAGAGPHASIANQVHLMRIHSQHDQAQHPHPHPHLQPQPQPHPHPHSHPHPMTDQHVDSEFTLPSSTWLAIPILFMVLLTFAGSMGCSALIGIPFSATTCCLTPFVAFAVIALPLHHMINVYFASMSINDFLQPLRFCQIIPRFLGRIVHAQLILITFSMLILCIGYIFPIPALRHLIIQLLLVLVFSLLLIFWIFPALFAIDFFKKFNYVRLELCGPDVRYADNEPDANLELCKSKLTQLTLANNGGPILHPHANQLNAHNLHDAHNHYRHHLSMGTACNMRSCASHRKYWFNMVLDHKMIQFTFLLANLLFTIFCLLGLIHLQDGLELSDVVPRTTDEHHFLRAQQKHMGVYHMHVVTTNPFDYAQAQRLLLQLHDSIAKVPNVVRRPDQRAPDFWLPLFRDWLLSLQNTFEREWNERRVHLDGWHRNASADAILAFKLLVQTGRNERPVDRRLIAKKRKLVDEHGLINTKAFYHYLTAWVNCDAITYSASQASFRPEPKQWTHEPSDTDLRIPRANTLQFAQMPFILQQLDTNERILTTIRNVHSVCGQFAVQGLPSFPVGLPFLFWQQFTLLRQLLLLAIGVCVVITALYTFYVTGQVRAIPLPVAIIILFNVQMIGMINRLQLQLNAIPCVAIILANVIILQTLLYQTIVFVSIKGDFKQRVVHMLDATRSVYIHKSISIAIAIGILYISDFDYIFKYFFEILSFTILIEIQIICCLHPLCLFYCGPAFVAELIDRPMVFKATVVKPLTTTTTETASVFRQSMRTRRSVRRAYHTLKTEDPVTARDSEGTDSDQQNKNRVHSQISLSTISEEPNDYQSSREIIMKPHLVLETTTTSSAYVSPLGGRTAVCYTPTSDSNKTPTCQTPVTTEGTRTPSTDRESPMDHYDMRSSSSASDYGKSGPPLYTYLPPPKYSEVIKEINANIRSSHSEQNRTNPNPNNQGDRGLPNYDRPSAPSPPEQIPSRSPSDVSAEINHQVQLPVYTQHPLAGYAANFACNQLMQQTVTTTKVTTTAKLTFQLPSLSLSSESSASTSAATSSATSAATSVQTTPSPSSSASRSSRPPPPPPPPRRCS